MKPHIHAEAIKAWADGAEMEWRQNEGPWHKLDEPVHWPNEGEGFEFRIKPAEPEREPYPQSAMTDDDLYEAIKHAKHPCMGFRFAADAALRHACDAGQIVTRAEFDRAVGERARRDHAIARNIARVHEECAAKGTSLPDLIDITNIVSNTK